MARSFSAKLRWVTRHYEACGRATTESPFNYEEMETNIQPLKQLWNKYNEAYMGYEDQLLGKENTKEYDKISRKYHE